MPGEVAARAIDHFLSEYPVDSEAYSIACENPDDPRMDRELVAWVTGYAFKRGRQLAKNVEIAPVTTSGAGITPELLRDWERHGGPPRVTVSVDGPPEVHDALRRHPSGRGSHAEALQAVGLLQEARRMGDLLAVVTPHFPDLVAVYSHLRSIGGCKVRTRPVRASPRSPHAFTRRNMRVLCGAYSRFADMLLSLATDELLAWLGSIAPADCFLRVALGLLRGDRRPYRCGAARHQFRVDADGEIYGCDGFVGDRPLSIGNIAEGVDPERHAVYWTDLHVDNLRWCRSCWARYLCGGPCYHQAHLSHGRLDRPERAECTLNLHLLGLARRFLDTVSEKHPAALSALRAIAAPSQRESAGRVRAVGDGAA